MYLLVTTSHFDRRIAKFVRAHPELRKPLAAVLRDLETGPFRPELRLHQLQGALEGLYAVRLSYSDRITLTLELDEKEIVLLDIGSHDEVYR